MYVVFKETPYNLSCQPTMLGYKHPPTIMLGLWLPYAVPTNQVMNLSHGYVAVYVCQAVICYLPCAEVNSYSCDILPCELKNKLNLFEGMPEDKAASPLPR